MALSAFETLKWTREKDHPQYRTSVLMPVAPEWTVGEVLLAAAYRKLILGYPEGEVDRTEIKDHLLKQLTPQAMWYDLLTRAGGLASPTPAREHLGLRQLMPLVPEIALYAGALGRKRKGRWEPGNLLMSAIQTGAGLGQWRIELDSFTEALKVDQNDDLFAQFVEHELRRVRKPGLHLKVDSSSVYAPAWRLYCGGQRIPAERFVEDLRCIVGLKSRLTRRQWTVLVETLLRLALGMHMLWVCRLNEQIWAMALEALEQGKRPSPEDVEARCWSEHGSTEPLLELGNDAGRMIKRRISGYAQARIGINLILHALDDAPGASWTEAIGVSATAAETPQQKIADFLTHVAHHAAAVTTQVRQQQSGCQSIREFAGRVADANPKFVRADSGAVTKNLLEFLSHTLVAMNVAKSDAEMASYDQGYIAVRPRNKVDSAAKLIKPGPAVLMLLVHACCSDQGQIPASIDDFRQLLLDYGISAPAGELQSGATGRNMEALGLVVDSPDAGGGRLLVNPF